MEPARTTTAITPEGLKALFLIRGGRGRMLRAQLASLHPGHSEEEIEDSIQATCRRLIHSGGQRW